MGHFVFIPKMMMIICVLFQFLFIPFVSFFLRCKTSDVYFIFFYALCRWINQSNTYFPSASNQFTNFSSSFFWFWIYWLYLCVCVCMWAALFITYSHRNDFYRWNRFAKNASIGNLFKFYSQRACIRLFVRPNIHLFVWLLQKDSILLRDLETKSEAISSIKSFFFLSLFISYSKWKHWTWPRVLENYA